MFLANKIRFHQHSFSATVVKIGITSIIIGISTLLIAISVLFGFKNTIKNKLYSLNGNIQVSKITLNQSYDEIPFERNLKTEEIFKQNKKINAYFGVLNKSGILKSETEIAGILMKGVDSSFAQSPFVSNLVEGHWISQKNQNELIISKVLAKKLKINLNDNMLIYFIQQPPRARKFKVVGIYETGIVEYDNNLVYINRKVLENLNKWKTDQIGHYEVFLKNVDDEKMVIADFEEKLPNEFSYLTIQKIVPQFYDWFDLLDRNILIVIILILFVAAFNMISVLLIMLMERTPMIGILKSLGMTNQKIRGIFLANGIIIILKGIIWGNLIGFSIALIQKYFKIIPLDPSNYYMNYIPIELDLWAILLINVLTILIVGLTLLLPTYFIFKISPVKALKFKD